MSKKKSRINQQKNAEQKQGMSNVLVNYRSGICVQSPRSFAVIQIDTDGGRC